MAEHGLPFETCDTPLMTVREALADNKDALQLYKLRMGAAALIESSANFDE